MPPDALEQAHNAIGCGRCGWTGWYSLDVPTTDARFGKLYPCECQSETLSARLQAACNLTKEERKWRLAKIHTTSRPGTQEMVDAARAFVRNPRGILTLWGGSGNAKTLVLQAVVNECIAAGIPAVYFTFIKLLDWVRLAYEEKEESAIKRTERAETIRVLAIDEMDIEKVNDTKWVYQFQTSVLDTRYRLGLSGQVGTIIAMNNPPDHHQDWIVSRLSDGRNTTVHNQDSDMRPMMK